MKEMAENMEHLIGEIEDYSILIQKYINNDYSNFDVEDEEELEWEINYTVDQLFETIKIVRDLINNR